MGPTNADVGAETRLLSLSFLATVGEELERLGNDALGEEADGPFIDPHRGAPNGPPMSHEELTQAFYT